MAVRQLRGEPQSGMPSVSTEPQPSSSSGVVRDADLAVPFASLTMVGRALAIAADPALARDAARRLLDGMRVASTVKAESAKIALLAELVRASGGGDLLPLKPQALEVALGAMKSAGYRAGSAYVGAARRYHVRLGHELTPYLAAWCRAASRSMDRDIGPTTKAPTFRPHWRGCA